MNQSLFTLKEVQVVANKNQGSAVLLNSLSFDIRKEETLGLIGKTGSGKTMIAKFLIDLLPDGVNLKHGDLFFESKTVLKTRASMRGIIISMIFQDPLKSLNPVHTIKKQFNLLLHKRFGYNENQCEELAKKWLEEVQLSRSLKILNRYPHQLSGGQMQRVMIAMAISIEPQLIIADEITTALDANLKFEILNLLNRLRLRVKTSILFITHDLILAKKYCDRISVLKEGSIVEINTAKKLFKFPEHPYTKTLVSAIKSNALETNKKNNYKNKPLALEVKKVKKAYGSTQVLDNISVSLLKNSTFGIIGESGSGKSTLVKIILNILKRDSGSVNLINKNLEKKLLTKPNKQVSAVFQDSLSSLNPKMTIRQILFEPLNILKIKNKDSIVLDILNRVDLKEALLNRFPNQISGGQRQRVSIARAIITKPKILILDEPTSSLDLDIQEKIIQLVLKVKEENNLSLLFISHDLAVINKVSDYIGVMHKGKIIEQGLKFDVLKNPKEDYTKKLIRSAYDVTF